MQWNLIANEDHRTHPSQYCLVLKASKSRWQAKPFNSPQGSLFKGRLVIKHILHLHPHLTSDRTVDLLLFVLEHYYKSHG